MALARYAWLSVAASVTTLALKFAAYRATGSVGLLSDALESIVNVVAALVALVAVRIAETPPDEGHPYGHEKVEYFSGGLEGGLVLVAGVGIVASAIPRLLSPRPIEHVGLGLGLSTVAAAINLLVARTLIGAGKQHRSIALEADGHHLMTDVWTSVGVLLGVGAVVVTKRPMLDPLIALGVAVQVLFTGASLIRRSAAGLLDAALSPGERDAIVAVLDRYAKADGITWHALRTRRAGRKAFAEVHVLVPGAWTVQRGHDLLEQLEEAVRAAVPGIVLSTHLEPIEDERAFRD